MLIPQLIKLYRKSKQRKFSNNYFEGTVVFDNESKVLISELKKDKKIDFEELVVDEEELFEDSDLPEIGEKIYFGIRCPTSDANRFYTNISQMLHDCSHLISKGDLPKQFYIIESDYSFEDEQDNKPTELKTIEKVCQFIKKLSKIAHYHDSKKSNGYHKLIFIKENEHTGTLPLTIETLVDKSILDIKNFHDTKILDELTSDIINQDIHHIEKKNLFYESLAEFLIGQSTNQSDYFKELLINWDKFSHVYQTNLGTYLSGFTFHKAKKEVAEAELKLADDYSKVISDITGKLLSIPLSFAILIPISKPLTLMYTRFLLELCLMVTGLIVMISIFNQKRQLKRIQSAKKLIFSAFDGKKEIYPEALKTHINNMKTALNKNEKCLECTLNTYLLICWLPSFIGLIMISLFLLFPSYSSLDFKLLDIFKMSLC